MSDTITVKPGDKFVCSWGYDQTQYSTYNVVSVKGKFVSVEGLGSWSSLGESDLTVGSKVKVYTFKRWDNLTHEEQQDLTSRGFDWNSYNYHYGKEAKEAAPVRTIVKMQRIDGKSWSYIWTLDNGEVIRSDENYKLDRHIEIVRGLKRCLVQISKYNSEPYIKIDEVITATLDPDYVNNSRKYAEQNEYTAYNGR